MAARPPCPASARRNRAPGPRSRPPVRSASASSQGQASSPHHASTLVTLAHIRTLRMSDTYIQFSTKDILLLNCLLFSCSVFHRSSPRTPLLLATSALNVALLFVSLFLPLETSKVRILSPRGWMRMAPAHANHLLNGPIWSPRQGAPKDLTILV